MAVDCKIVHKFQEETRATFAIVIERRVTLTSMARLNAGDQTPMTYSPYPSKKKTQKKTKKKPATPIPSKEKSKHHTPTP